MYLAWGWAIILAIIIYVIAYNHGHNTGSSNGHIVGYEKGKADGYAEGYRVGQQQGQSVATAVSAASFTPEPPEDPKKQRMEIQKQLALLEKELPGALISEQELSAKEAQLEARKMVEDLRTDLENNRHSYRLDSTLKWLDWAKKERILKNRYGERLKKAYRYIASKEFIPVSEKEHMKTVLGVGDAGIDWITGRLVRERKLEPIEKNDRDYDGNEKKTLTGWAVIDKIYEGAKTQILSDGEFTHNSLCDYLRKQWNVGWTGRLAMEIATKLELEGIIAPKAIDNKDYSYVRKVLTKAKAAST